MSHSPPSVPDALHAFPQRCSSCSSELETPIACSGCHTIFSVPDGMSHFTRLGLPESFAVDLPEAERRFLALSRELHPDFFTTRPGTEQALSLDHTARLNEAIAVIRDPFRRAAYLLQRWAPQSSDVRDQGMPAHFLEELLFLREEIDEVRAAAPSPERDAALDGFRADLMARRDDLAEQLATGFARLEDARAHATDYGDIVTELRHALNATGYVTGTLQVLREARN